MTLFAVVKYIHILAAITAVGLNVSYGIWLARARSSPSNIAFALKGVKFLDDRIANPAYGVLLITGLLMVYLLPVPITSLWIIIALILYAALVVVALAFYTPALRSQVKLAEAGDTSSAEFARLTARGTVLGATLGVIVLIIVAMMVFKPTL
jgi:uncharacterized membrane protein